MDSPSKKHISQVKRSQFLRKQQHNIQQQSVILKNKLSIQETERKLETIQSFHDPYTKNCIQRGNDQTSARRKESINALDYSIDSVSNDNTNRVVNLQGLISQSPQQPYTYKTNKAVQNPNYQQSQNLSLIMKPVGNNTTLQLKQTNSLSFLKGELPDIIKYCHKENIAFTDSERMHYEINMCKKNHRMYAKCLKQCFKSSYQDEVQTALQQLSKIDSVLLKSHSNQQYQQQQQYQKNHGASGSIDLNISQHKQQHTHSIQHEREKSMQNVVNNIQDLQQYAEDIKKRKQQLKDQSYIEINQKKLMIELSSKIDDPNSNEKFTPTMKQVLKKAISRKFSKIKQDYEQKQKSAETKKLLQRINKGGITTGSLSHKQSVNFDILEKTQIKMQKSKNRLSKDLLKVLEKVEIDRPSIIQQKARLLIKDNDNNQSVYRVSPTKNSIIMEQNQSILEQSFLQQTQQQSQQFQNNTSQSPLKKKISQHQLLDEMKRQNKKKLEHQRQAYLSLLEYIKLRGRTDRDCRVSEDERKIFDTLKIIFDGSWMIQSAQEFMSILKEINVIKFKKSQMFDNNMPHMDEQLYFFLWYAFECLSFDTQVLDLQLEQEMGIDLLFAKQRKQLLALMINEHQQQQYSVMNTHRSNESQIYPQQQHFDMRKNSTFTDQDNNLKIPAASNSIDFTQMILNQQASNNNKVQFSPSKKNLQEILIKTLSGSSHSLKRSNV